ncbi:MAG: type II CAAX prenyl endopeptidase Rce1 family protein [Myxococcaceae bacterium]
MCSGLWSTAPARVPEGPAAEGGRPVSRLRLGLGLVALASVGLLAATPLLVGVLKAMLAGRRVPLPLGFILVLQDAQALVLASLAATVGLWTAPRVGLDAPLLRARLGGAPVAQRLLRLLPPSVLAGSLGALSVLALSSALKPSLPAVLFALPSLRGWAGASGAFYGGLVEELLFRWGLLSLVAFALDRLGLRQGTGFWAANLAAALAFGLLHLPPALQLGVPLTPLVVAYLLAGNAVVGLVCGWLFRRRGLESAMVGHASADLWLHAVFPALGL